MSGRNRVFLRVFSCYIMVCILSKEERKHSGSTVIPYPHPVSLLTCGSLLGVCSSPQQWAVNTLSHWENLRFSLRHLLCQPPPPRSLVWAPPHILCSPPSTSTRSVLVPLFKYVWNTPLGTMEFDQLKLLSVLSLVNEGRGHLCKSCPEPCRAIRPFAHFHHRPL